VHGPIHRTMRIAFILKIFATVSLSWLLTSAVVAQNTVPVTDNESNSAVIPDTGAKVDSVQSLVNRADSSKIPYADKLERLDSLQHQYQQNNVIIRSVDKADSIQNDFYHRSDSLKNSYQNKLAKIDVAKLRLQNKLDSLTTLKLPDNGVTSRLDSLNTLRASTLDEFDEKLQSLKDKSTGKLKSLDLPPEATGRLNTITKNIEGVNSSSLDIPALDGVGNPLGKGSEIDELSSLSNVNVSNPLQSGITEKTGELKIPNGDAIQLSSATENASDVTKVTEQVSEYSDEAKQIAQGNVDEVKNLPKTAEEKVAKVSGISEMEQQTKGLDEYKGMVEKAKDPEALKKEMVEKAKQRAVNHFAGKEEQLKAAMEKIAKYKQKYSSMNGIKELAKKPRNEMHDKPLIERILPGVAIQLQSKGDNLLVDFNPYAGYRFTKRIIAGVGWNQRMAYNTKQYRFNPDLRVYGPRAFGEFKIGKGFSPRAEVELMNSGIPPLIQTTYDPSKRDWVWGAFAGMKKEYKLYKNIKGTAMVMARLLNPNNKSPYADIVNVRFGFEFPMKKKVKQQTDEGGEKTSSVD